MKQYHAAEGLEWVNHGNQILVVNEVGVARTLAGAEAALWRWLHQTYTGEEIRCLFSALLNISAAEAEVRLEKVLQRWLENGLVEVQGG
jgi:hypothetical protein